MFKVDVKPGVGFYDADSSLPWYLPITQDISELNETEHNTQLGMF